MTSSKTIFGTCTAMLQQRWTAAATMTHRTAAKSAMVAALGMLAFAVPNASGADYFNGFEIDLAGWTSFSAGFHPTRVPTGTNGITSATGGFHAESSATGSAGNWGGYNYGAGNAVPTVFQEYTTSVDIYLNVEGGWANNTRFDFSSAINNSGGTHRRDFIFNAGFYNDTDGSPGSGTNRFIVSASTNSQPGSAFAKNPAMGPIAISITGWYTFKHHFYNNGGVLAVDMTIHDSSDNLVNSWTRSDASDLIGAIGGNRYGWFDYNQFTVLAFDNSELVIAPPPTLSINPVSVCSNGSQVIAKIRMSNQNDLVVGGQFFLEYDNAALDFVSADPGSLPFDTEVYESVNEGAGTIDYAVGVSGGGPGTMADTDMVVLTFDILVFDTCETSDLISFRAHTPPTQLTNMFGDPIVPQLNDLPSITIDSTPPVLTCVPNMTVECDESTLPANTGTATATDNCGAAIVTYTDATPVVVTAANLNGWLTTASGGASTTFVNGPGTPPLGSGSVRLALGPNGNDAAQAGTNAHAFTPLADLTQLSYSTYRTQDGSGGQCVYIIMRVDNDNNGSTDDLLFFEPEYQNNYNPNLPVQGPLVSGAWQHWNALVGGWWSLNNIAGAGPGTNVKSLSQYLAVQPSSRIANVVSGAGSVRLVAGFGAGAWDNFDGAADNFKIGTAIGSSTYDLELNPANGGPCPDYIVRTWTATDSCGNTSVCRQTITVEDSIAPVITCPSDVGPVNADAGQCTAVVTVGTATATDNCDANPTIVGVRSDNPLLPLTDPYPTGVTTITWTATDACGNESECEQTVTVNAYNTMLVDIDLAGSFSTTFTRCVRFELSSGGPGTTVVNQDITFVNGSALNVPVNVPCGNYTCITARDTKHTLRRTDSGFTIIGVNYDAEFTTAAGDALVGGNLNGDQWIDILDFGVFVGQFSTNPGADTPCGYVGNHADISGDGTVNVLDFNFISLNFLLGNEANCSGVSGFTDGGNGPSIGGANSGPILRISVKELIRRGMRDAVAGDVNHDGWLDQQDIAAFLNGG